MQLCHGRSVFPSTTRSQASRPLGVVPKDVCLRQALAVAPVSRKAFSDASTSRRGSCCTAGAYSSSSTTSSAEVEKLSKQLKALEQERDDAVAVAESCAKTCVKLNEMSRLLDDLALSKVKEGDEEGAKSVLQERKSLKEIIEKNSSKAQANFALAGKLAEKIGDLQSSILALTSPSARTPSSSSSTPYASSPASASGSSGTYQTSFVPAWQKSLLEAQVRLREQEAAAERLGRLARADAEASINAAKERIARERGSAGESILEARDRLRRSAEESIAEARERLRRQDAEVLEYCRRIVARYRRGEYVSDAELEFAFQQLEKRLL